TRTVVFPEPGPAVTETCLSISYAVVGFFGKSTRCSIKTIDRLHRFFPCNLCNLWITSSYCFDHDRSDRGRFNHKIGVYSGAPMDRRCTCPPVSPRRIPTFSSPPACESFPSLHQ